MAINKLSSEVFYWDAPRRRLHKRDLFPLQMEINGSIYFVSQWTLKHFKIVNYSDEVKLGQDISIKPIVKFRDFNIQFDATATLLHYDAQNQELIATFKEMSEEHQELLKYFSEALSSGDMVNIDNILRRVDMPVTPASMQLAEVPKTKRQNLKRRLYSSLYLLIGGLLLLFTITTFYNSLFLLKVETAFVNSEITPVQSHSQGSIKTILVGNNEQVSAGQPLLTLDISHNDRIPKQYQLKSAKQQVALYQALLSDNKTRTKHQTRLGQTKLNAAKAALQAATIHRTLKCNRLYATEIDRRNPRKRSAECQIARKKVTVANAKVKASLSYLKAAKKSYKNSTKSNRSSNESFAVLQAKLEQAQQRVDSIKNTPESLLGIETIYSPISGKIINMVNLENQYLKKGQLIAVIQKNNSEQFIEAHITHEEAAKLTVGSKAVAYSPVLARDYPMVVKQVDFTSDVLAMSKLNLFTTYIPKNKNAKVTLKFIDKESETLSFALPVKLSIEKQNKFTNKVKASLANLLDLLMEKAHADTASTTTSPLEYCSIYTPDPLDCRSGTHLFPQHFINQLKAINSKGTKEKTQTKQGNHKKSAFLNIEWQQMLLKKANRLLKKPSTPIQHLKSAGITHSNNKSLKKTRAALQDANNSALLALAYYVKGDDDYLKQAKKYLLAWAKIHQPNGHPINETRLEGFLWAYDLLYCEFNQMEHRKIKIWLLNLQRNKHSWKFGPSSSKNNLRTHQLKILLMLDRLLEDEQALNGDKEQLKRHLDNNLQQNGISFDYQERDALHYHVYNLEPWLEIALLEPHYLKKIKVSYEFLIKQIETDNIHHQFANSKQKIDSKRAKGGFSYAKKGGTFDTKRITRSVITFNTLQQTLDNKIEQHLSEKKIRQSLLFHTIRYHLWNRP
jgi:multidrug resistance efflux pump